MSQRECAGFNWPPLAISAEEPISISPEAVSRAGPQIAAKSCNHCCTFEPSGLVICKADSGLPVLSLLHEVVGQPASSTVFRLESLLPAALFPFCAGVPAMGVGRPVQPLPDVRAADARSAQIGRSDGVARCFQVSLYKVEPHEAVRACNLLAKDCWRAALLDGMEEGRP